MISDATAYVTDKITETATERLGGVIVQGATIAIFAVGALTFALVAGYLYLALAFGRLEAASMLAVGCLSLAILAWLLPKAFRQGSRRLEKDKSAPEAAFRAVDEEASDAVDYFGAAKVMATAFMFGFSAARRIKT